MKLSIKILLVPALIASLGLFSCGKAKKEEEKAPEKVETAFKQKFPQATDVEWDKESDTEWEAEFKMDGKEYTANFSTAGEWQETEYEIAVTEIPAAIKTNVDSTYAGYKIEDVEISETNKGKQYELKLEKGEESIGVFYTEDGVFINQEKEEEKGEKENEKEDDDKKEGDKE